ncbi:hypothetical protein IV417_11935 [Alphaproteobacteria bacterium KMM 3653]|uniref:Uncharacterized protein n=1 Tax=Harenicola maris TaxID=2841044 RepID=A0AAP2CUS8_9RHOB|nr:hypothetical protein [Harenicola maris]
MAILRKNMITCPGCNHRAELRFAEGNANMVRQAGTPHNPDAETHYDLLQSDDWQRGDGTEINCKRCGQTGVATLPRRSSKGGAKPLPLRGQNQ